MNLEESRARRRELSFIPAELRPGLYETEAWVFGIKPGERGDSIPSVEATLASVVLPLLVRFKCVGEKTGCLAPIFGEIKFLVGPHVLRG